MATVLNPPVISPPALRHKKFTRAEMDRILETGILAGQRLELIDKMSPGPRHAGTIQILADLLVAVFGQGHIRTQLPIEAGGLDREWSQPEPDVAVLRARGNFQHRHPEGHELLFAMEVSDTSVRHDSGRKRDIYANAAVPEYWVLDLEGRKLLVFRSLQSGAYTESLTLGEADSIPHINISVSELLG
jgi:Uma2 family endonuclease